MTRRLWIADEHRGQHAVITGDNARHLSHVLRARVGQQFDLACDGQVFAATISAIVPDRVEFTLGSARLRPVIPELTLMLAVFKFDRMEWVLEKATELGVTRILPIIAQRTDAHLARAAEKRTERWRKIVHAAAQQSRRSSEPALLAPLPLTTAYASVPDGQRLVLAETERQVRIADWLASTDSAAPLALAVGPEGGWTESELAELLRMGWNAVSLGDNILRAETAAIAALALCALR